MITKGYIIKRVSEESNKFIVRLPIYETVDNPTEEALYEATVSYVPGNLNVYRPGDCVFVSFEDNDPSKLIILGKLYLGDDEEAVAAQNAQTLDVSGTAQLSSDTYVGGVRIDKAFASKVDIQNIQQQVDKQITYRIKLDSEGNPIT